MMQPPIRVRLQRPSGSGRLHARYNAQANILEVGSGARRRWPFGIDIDGRMIFDLDRDRLLANFDLLIPRSRWQLDPALLQPNAHREADLEFTREATDVKSFHMPIKVHTTSTHDSVRITLGSDLKGEVIALSRSVNAFVDDGILTGFFVVLQAPA